MSENVSWFGDEKKGPKEIIKGVSKITVGVGKIVVVGVMCGLGLKAVGSSFD